MLIYSKILRLSELLTCFKTYILHRDKQKYGKFLLQFHQTTLLKTAIFKTVWPLFFMRKYMTATDLMA